MSLRDEIQRRCEDGSLYQLHSQIPGATERRVIYVAAAIKPWLVGPWGDPAYGRRWGRVRNDLEMFLFGYLIPVPKTGRKSARAFMQRLQPPSSPEVWEVRCRRPKPSIRLFGRFSDKNELVLLDWDYRAYMGAEEDRAWRDMSVRITTDWTNLFPAYPPWSGGYPHDYLSDPFIL